MKIKIFWLLLGSYLLLGCGACRDIHMRDNPKNEVPIASTPTLAQHLVCIAKDSAGGVIFCSEFSNISAPNLLDYRKWCLDTVKGSASAEGSCEVPVGTNGCQLTESSGEQKTYWFLDMTEDKSPYCKTELGAKTIQKS